MERLDISPPVIAAGVIARRLAPPRAFGRPVIARDNGAVAGRGRRRTGGGKAEDGKSKKELQALNGGRKRSHRGVPMACWR
jgi:hypothetical protein